MDDPVYENFRNLAQIAAESRQDTPLTEESRAILETRLEKIRPFIRDQPNHPSYYSMILEAIRNLNGEMGSSEEAISNFIKRMYKNLPWAHSTFLKYQLNNLCESGKIWIDHDNLYTEYQQKKCSKLGRLHKLEEDERMEVLELDKPHRPPIILKFRLVPHNSVTTDDVGTSCSDPNPKPMGHKELMVPHPRIDEGKKPCPMVQLGRGQYNKRKTTRFSLNLNHNELEGPTTRPHGRPPSRKDIADEFEALRLGEETKHKLELLPPKEFDVGTRTDRFKPSIPTGRRSKRPPRCKLKDNGQPRVIEPKIAKSRITKPSISDLIPEGVIIALPALAAQVRQRDPRNGRVKV